MGCITSKNIPVAQIADNSPVLPNEIEKEECLDKQTDYESLESKIMYFDEYIWSIGTIHEINAEGTIIKDCFTGKTRKFNRDSEAISQKSIDHNYSKRPSTLGENLHLGISGVEREFLWGSYIDTKYKYLSSINQCDICKTYRFLPKNNIPFDKLIIGMKVKLYIKSLTSNDTLRHSYVYGYVYGIGKKYATIISRIYVKGNNVLVKLVIPKKHSDKICYVDSHNEIKLLTPVIYNNKAHVIVDISGDMVKLSGINNFIETSKLTSRNIISPDNIESFEDMIALKPEECKLGDSLPPPYRKKW